MKEPSVRKPCEWCGSDRHSSDNCPTRNLVRFLNDEQLPENGKFPDFASVMTEQELFSKTEEELHDEVKSLTKTKVKTSEC